jgi:hypothetical protein
MTDPFGVDTPNLSPLVTEILSYLTLDELQASAREVAQNWNSVCNEQKQHWFQTLSKAKAKALLFGLKSPKGQALNGRIATIKGVRNTEGRFPIQVTNYLTGVTENIGVKACNLNPFVVRVGVDQEEENILKYSDNSKLRQSHATMLDQLLMLARYECNIINGLPGPEDFDAFMMLPRGHPCLVLLNSTLFTWFRTSPALAGHRQQRGKVGPVMDLLVRALIDGDQEQIYQKVAEQAPLWKTDGPRGKYMARNFVHFMKAWDRERVTGHFLVTHIFPTGTIMVKVEEDMEEGQYSFGKVYLVKGHNSVLGEFFPTLPAHAMTTILPIYNLLTYDGAVAANHGYAVTRDLKQRLERHVQNAISTKNVVWRGESAARGEWDAYPPPPFPTIRDHNDEMGTCTLEWGDQQLNTSESDESAAITERHWELGRQVVRLAKRRGGVDSTNHDTYYVFRRQGYSFNENREGICAVLYNRKGECKPAHRFLFKVDRDDRTTVPTYTLEEVLVNLIETIKNTPRGYKMAYHIQPDELSVVKPLATILKQLFEEEKLESPKVLWYPPPSKEESAFAAAHGPGLNM